MKREIRRYSHFDEYGWADVIGETLGGVKGVMKHKCRLQK